MEPLQLNDFLNYRFLSQPRFAPGGARAAFAVANCNEEENAYESRLWLWEGGALRQLTDLGKEAQYLWEDETHILFPAVRSAAEKKRAEAKDQFTPFYRLDVTGGEALPAFTLPFAAGPVYRVTEALYVAVGLIDANHPDYYKLDKEGRAAVAKEYEENRDYEVLDEIPFWINGQGFVNKRRTALFLCNVATGEVSRVTEPLLSVDSVAVSGTDVYFTGESYAAKSREIIALWKLDCLTGEARCLQETMPIRVHGLLTAGDRLLALGTDSKRHGLNENAFVYGVNPADGSLTLIRAEEENMYSSVGSDCRYGGGESCQARGREVFHLTTRWGSSHLYRLTPGGESLPVITEDGSIDAFAVSPDSDTVLLVAMYGCRLQELYAYDLASGALTQVSHFNDAPLAGKYVAQPQRLTLESGGWEIEGWVLLPKDFDPAKTYPAVLDIHGGPKTVYGPVFYHEMQLWANRGYFVLYCNPMGSDGRGNAFADIRGHYGETDYENIMDFTDVVLSKYPQIDKKRVAVTGGSYGGFMTNWIIGHTDRFACAASQRSISNWLSFYGVSDIGPMFATDQCDGDPFDTPEKLWAHSPLRYAKNVVTPTLFIHSDEDHRCPMPEGMQMFTALTDRGVPARLCYFRGENHELSRSGKPKHRIRRLKEITDWIEKYTK
ncbi:MAG: S9 family peptidase [Candidatus Faecousia sp.]|nr:S9 family peptidase [Bacillota bacterium]MDY4220293.1 S9 family peptidase [Candidatus Faecousia sp.]